MADQGLLHYLRLKLLHAFLETALQPGEQRQVGGLRLADRGAQHARRQQFGAEPGDSESASMRKNFVLQLAHVARPAVGGNAGGLRFAGKTFAALAECLLRSGKQAFGKQRYIHRSIAQRRDMQLHGGQAVKDLPRRPARTSSSDRGCWRQPRAHRPTPAVRRQAAELAFLQHAQQLDLEGRRGFADFVRKSAAVGLLETADPVFVGAGEGARL